MANDWPIPKATSAAVFNDMMNGNLVNKDPETTRKIQERGFIANAVRWTATAREAGLPLFWIRVERREDVRDRVFQLTDVVVASGATTAPKSYTPGSFEAQNIEELPIHPEDFQFLKPRQDPFVGTDLDLMLRTLGIDTIIIGGISTIHGVEAAVRHAFNLDYNVVVLRDCCFHADLEVNDFTLDKILPNYARVLTSEQVAKLLA